MLYIHSLVSIVHCMQEQTTVDDVREDISELKDDIKQRMMVGTKAPLICLIINICINNWSLLCTVSRHKLL